MSKLIPFNYDLLEKGYKPVTREEQLPVTQIVKFEVRKNTYCIYGVVDGSVLAWPLDGRIGCAEENYDLVMLPPVTEKLMIVGNGFSRTYYDLETAKNTLSTYTHESFLIKATYQDKKIISVELVN